MIDWAEEKLIDAGYKIKNAKIIDIDLSTAYYCAADLNLTLDGDGWGDTVKIIGHITKDQWFDYGSFFKEEIDNGKE